MIRLNLHYQELPKWVLEDCFIHDDSFVSFREFF
ncbi:hypothetical protein QQP08_012407 [Theobroma cacao]|nr:hypothetical protein QQP08_012407 [Theobroma cacao]